MPLRKHFLHAVCPGSMKHLILCFLHSAPVKYLISWDYIETGRKGMLTSSRQVRPHDTVGIPLVIGRGGVIVYPGTLVAVHLINHNSG